MKMYPSHDLYKHYRERRLGDATNRMTIEHMNYAINLCESWDSFIDIGGGSGHYGGALAAMFKKGVIIDIAQSDALDALARRFPNIKAVVSPIEKYNTEHKADFILLADLFEHIPDIKPFAAKLSSLQSKGGVVYILTPNPLFCGPAGESGIHHSRHPFGHIKHYTKYEIEAIMAEVGYHLEFFVYEETQTRQRIKNIVRGLARRVPPNLMFLFAPVNACLAARAYRADYYADLNEFKTVTQCLAFKKI